jgi:small subunit ribosomal protein S10
MTNDKETIRVRLESFSHELLTSSYKKIVTILNSVPLDSLDLVTLPTNKRIYCVLRSPHVDKDSREHFEVRVHKRMIEISYDSEVDVFELLSKTNLPSGVTYKIYFKNL